MLSEQQLIEAVRENDPKVFVRDRLFGSDCWLFEQRGIRRIDTSYAKLKQSISQTLDINPNEVSMIGSGKLGVSIAPGKAFRAFRTGRSDIDLAIVSQRLFTDCWAQLSHAYFEGYQRYRDDHAKQIFCHFLILNGAETYKSSYLQDLARSLLALNKSVNDNVKIKHRVNYRIYDGWDAAERYHIEGIKRLRKELGRGDSE